MNIEKARAEHAYNTIKNLPRDVKKYTSYVKALPASILQTGLGQAMATLLAASKGDPEKMGDKIKSAHRLLFNHMQSWLCRSDGLAPYTVESEPGSNSYVLMDSITQHSEEAYIHAQTEALAYLDWLKKFAVALRPEKDGQNDRGTES